MISPACALYFFGIWPLMKLDLSVLAMPNIER